MLNQLPEKLFTPFRHISKRTGAILLSCFVASIIAFFLATVHFLNLLLIEDRVQSRSIRFMRNFVGSKEFDKKLKIILIRKDQQGDAPRGDINKSHRKFFGDLVKAMKDAEARVLAFDISFDGKSEFDKAFFGEAVSEAERNKLKVIVGVDSYVNGKTDPELPRDLSNPRWGIIIVGGSQGDDSPIGTVKLADLPEANNNSGITSVVPSLALRVVMETEEPALVPYHDLSNNRLILYRDGASRDVVKSIPLERFNDLLIDQLTQNELNLARVDAHRIYQDLNDIDSLKANYKDAIVLVGYEDGEEKAVLSGGTRLGVELHATAVFNLLHNIFIFKLAPIYNYLIILLMAFLAALLYTPVASWLDYKVNLPIPKTDLKVPIPLTIIIIALIYLVVAFLVYKQTRTYLDICYHLLALGISYGLSWAVLKIWFPVKEKGWTLE